MLIDVHGRLRQVCACMVMGANVWMPMDDGGCFHANTSHRHNLACDHKRTRLYSAMCIVLEPLSYYFSRGFLPLQINWTLSCDHWRD